MMNDKILNFFDKLAGRYEDITERSANDTGMVAIVAGSVTSLSGEAISIISGHFLCALALSIMTFSAALMAYNIKKYISPLQMRHKLSFEASQMVALAILEFVVIFIPGNDYWESVAINTVAIGFDIFIFGQFFYASNPTPPEKRTHFQEA